MNLTIDGIFPDSNMLVVVLLDDMAKAAELKSERELKAKYNSNCISGCFSLIQDFHTFCFLVWDHKRPPSNVWQGCTWAGGDPLHEMVHQQAVTRILSLDTHRGHNWRYREPPARHKQSSFCRFLYYNVYNTVQVSESEFKPQISITVPENKRWINWA